MSLEAALAENTATMKQLIAVLQSAGLPVGATAADTAAAASAATKATTRTKKTETPAPSPAPAPAASSGANINDGKRMSLGGKTCEGDPDGTLYFHIEKHRTVAAVRPGEVVPTIEGMVEINSEEYVSLKAKYTAPVPSSAAAPTGAPAAAPASNTPSASPASATTSGASQPSGPIDGPAVLEKCKAVHAHLGNDALLAVLKKHVTGDPAPSVPKMIAKAELHAAAAADLDKLLALPKGALIDQVNAALAAAAAPAADNSLFG